MISSPLAPLADLQSDLWKFVERPDEPSERELLLETWRQARRSAQQESTRSLRMVGIGLRRALRTLKGR